jgi:hypothetical protein
MPCVRMFNKELSSWENQAVYAASNLLHLVYQARKLDTTRKDLELASTAPRWKTVV